MIVSRATFFFTGHHNQLSELHVNCVFIGFEYNYFISGAMLIINTFGTEICCVLLLPLLLDSRQTSERGSKNIEVDCTTQEGHEHAAALHMPPLVHLRHLCMQFLFLRRWVGQCCLTF